MNSPDNSNPGLFAKLRAGAVKAAQGLARLKRSIHGLTPRTQQADSELPDTHPLVVKSLIPRSHFTKRGPGVRASARQAFARMTSEQRATARRMGWLR